MVKLSELLRSQNTMQDRYLSPYVIAEAGVNHEGSMDLAKRLIEEAAEGGADAIKFQTYRASSIASVNSPAYWDQQKEPTKTQFDLFRKYDKFWEPEFRILKGKCDEVGIEFLSTPFDLEAARFLDKLMDVFKVSSSDITNKPFIDALCRYGKPILLSTGASNLEEIADAVAWIDAAGIPVALLHCVLNYPTADENAHLGMIQSLIENYPDRIIGYSDHTLPGNMSNLETAALLGAVVIEKHFSHDKTLPGNDHYHAMDKFDLLKFRKKMRGTQKIVGLREKQSLPSEQIARENARRSLVAVSRVERGSVIQKDHLTWKRPANGISPREINSVIGRTASRNIREDEIICWEMLS